MDPRWCHFCGGGLPLQKWRYLSIKTFHACLRTWFTGPFDSFMTSISLLLGRATGKVMSDPAVSPFPDIGAPLFLSQANCCMRLALCRGSLRTVSGHIALHQQRCGSHGVRRPVLTAAVLGTQVTDPTTCVLFGTCPARRHALSSIADAFCLCGTSRREAPIPLFPAA